VIATAPSRPARPSTVVTPPVAAAARVLTERRVIAGLALWTVVLAVVTWGRWGDPTMDTGYDLLAASRTAGGELPYVDFTYYYGPVPALLLGGIYAVVGTAVWPAVLLGLALSAAAVALTYVLARRFAEPVPAALAAALVAVAALSSANNSYVLPHSTSAPLAIVLALGVLVLLSRAPRSPRTLVAAGVLVGLTALTRPELAAPLYVAVVAWQLLGLRSHPDRRRGLRELALLLGPALALPAIGYGAFLLSVSPRELVLGNLYPQDFVDAAGRVILESHAPLTAGSFAELAGKLLLYAAGTAALVLGAERLARWRGGRPLALAALAVALVFAAVVAIRPETVRYYLTYAYGWIPAGAAIAALVLVRRARRTEADGGNGAILLVTLFLAVAVAPTYASFNPFPNAEHPEATPYVLPLAAVFLAWLHTQAAGAGRAAARNAGAWWLAILVIASAGLSAHDAAQETGTVRGPGGSLSAEPRDAAALQRALDAVLRETRAGDPVLFAPQLTSLYVLAEREDPLRELSLLPGALATPGDEERAIERMRDVRVAVTDRAPMTQYGHGGFGATFDRRLMAWLDRDFQRTAIARGPEDGSLILDVWTRRSR
jgi:hypothetical protein